MRNAFAGPWRCYIFPGTLWLLALGFLVKAYGFTAASGAMPVLIGWTTLVLASADILIRILGADHGVAVAGASGADLQRPESMARILAAIGAIVGLSAALVLVGILRAVPLFLLVALRWGGGRTMLFSVTLALAVTVLLWAVFSRLLQLDLYPGLLFGGDW